MPKAKHKYTYETIASLDIPLSNIEDINTGTIKIAGYIISISTRRTKRPGLTLFEANIKDDTGTLRAIWFNVNSVLFLDRTTKYIFAGDLKNEPNPTLISPVFSKFEDYEKYISELT